MAVLDKKDTNNSTTILIKSNEVLSTFRSSLGKSKKKDPSAPYNPYDHREVEHPNGFLGAFIHIVKTSLGTGILAIPRAFKSAGLLVGFIGTILVGLMCTHAIHILVKASQKVCRKTNTPSLGYAETAEEVVKLGPRSLRRFARFSRIFVEGGLFAIHFLADSVYVVFISISLTKLISASYPDIESWPDYSLKLIILIPLLICGQVRELKHLVPFSFIANLMLLLTFGITGYYMFMGIGDVKIEERSLAAGIAGIPSFFSTVLFSMEGIGTIMPVENSMTTSNFIGCPGVLNFAMAVIITLYTSIGFLGYYKFGEETAATITSNLPTKDLPAEIAQAAVAIAVFFSFMLVFYVPVDIVWSKIKYRIPESRWNISQIILRSTMIIIATGIAIAGGENLGLLIDLIGAIFLSTLGLFVPAFLEIIADWDEGFGVLRWRLIKNIIFMVLAFFGMCSGVYYAILDIMGLTE
ncbi:proton-coupled amino acid transporter-like protein CG1139 [Anthonomus grandis grandis]|uniref:proton-coupled amino acid transporter-like protein CG1139 n=1 Tax=Anthonomus grandis grandis TaxID=2921223 RepID=UPI002165FFC9|nr:proton-coupled amino acid transporter-like protein CG1139 [Anthonomus grandis grandis]XP_050307965.1 proton-coupled amino acid transporter-like protein CG1139 [Anthonomus grandis grandis]